MTGANGQLGRELKRIIKAKGNGHPDHTTADKNYYIFAGHDDLDITDEDAVAEYVAKNYINVIINCAAYTNVDKAENEGFMECLKVNTCGPIFLARAAKQNGCILIHISTDFVFDGKKNIPYIPEDKCRPISQYGKTKLAGEQGIVDSKCRYLIFRTSWLYSALSKNNFVYKIYDKIAHGTEKLNVVNDEIGNPTNARDLADFIYHIIEDNNSENRYLSKTGIYHFCNNGWIDRFVFARYIERCTKVDDYKIEYKRVFPIKGKENSIRPKYSVLDKNKTEDEFDWGIPDWDLSLEKAMEEIIENEAKQRRIS